MSEEQKTHPEHKYSVTFVSKVGTMTSHNIYFREREREKEREREREKREREKKREERERERERESGTILVVIKTVLHMCFDSHWLLKMRQH